MTFHMVQQSITGMRAQGIMNEGMIERDPEAVMVWIFQLVCVHSLYMIQ